MVVSEKLAFVSKIQNLQNANKDLVAKLKVQRLQKVDDDLKRKREDLKRAYERQRRQAEKK